MERFKKDPAVQKVLANTAKLSEVTSDGYDTVFYPGGHGWSATYDASSPFGILDSAHQVFLAALHFSWAEKSVL
jgi:putative intracellular protease/amidase